MAVALGQVDRVDGGDAVADGAVCRGLVTPTSAEGTGNVEHLVLGKKAADSVDDAALLPDERRPEASRVAGQHTLHAVDGAPSARSSPADDRDRQRARRVRRWRGSPRPAVARRRAGPPGSPRAAAATRRSSTRWAACPRRSPAWVAPTPTPSHLSPAGSRRTPRSTAGPALDGHRGAVQRGGDVGRGATGLRSGSRGRRGVEREGRRALCRPPPSARWSGTSAGSDDGWSTGSPVARGCLCAAQPPAWARGWQCACVRTAERSGRPLSGARRQGDRGHLGGGEDRQPAGGVGGHHQPGDDHRHGDDAERPAAPRRRPRGRDHVADRAGACSHLAAQARQGGLGGGSQR